MSNTFDGLMRHLQSRIDANNCGTCALAQSLRSCGIKVTTFENLLEFAESVERIAGIRIPRLVKSKETFLIAWFNESAICPAIEKYIRHIAAHLKKNST
jgi:hypothetical protein